MKKYIVAIEETIVQEFELAADNADEALNVAKEKYRNGEFVLDAGEVQLKQMSVILPQDKATEWTKF